MDVLYKMLATFRSTRPSMTVLQAEVFLAVALGEELTMGQVRTNLSIARSTASRVLVDLQRAGLLVRECREPDLRSTWYSLSDAGRSLVNSLGAQATT